MSTEIQKDTRATRDDTQALVESLKSLQRGSHVRKFAVALSSLRSLGKEGKQIFQWLEASDPSTNLVAARNKRNVLQASGFYRIIDF